MELNHLRDRWDDPKSVYRLIRAAHPEVNLYADLDVPTEDWDVLHQIESITNARLRDERGEATIVEDLHRAKGPGSSIIMAAFTHINPSGSRFSDGTYGVFYSADLEETCAREVAFHCARFLGDTQQPPQSMAYRLIKAGLMGSFFNLFHQDWAWLRSDDYAKCQELGRKTRSVIDFLNYESVRHPHNNAYAVFRPNSLSEARHVRYVDFFWDGKRVTHTSGVEISF